MYALPFFPESSFFFPSASEDRPESGLPVGDKTTGYNVSFETIVHVLPNP